MIPSNPAVGSSFKMQTGYSIPVTKRSETPSTEQEYTVTGQTDSLAPSMDSVMSMTQVKDSNSTVLGLEDVDSQANLQLQFQRDDEDPQKVNLVVTNPSHQGAPAVLMMPFGELPDNSELDQPLVVPGNFSKLNLTQSEKLGHQLFFESDDNDIGFLMNSGGHFSTVGTGAEQRFFGTEGAQRFLGKH